MKTRYDDLARHFGTLKGTSSVSQIWPRGAYAEFIPSANRGLNTRVVVPLLPQLPALRGSWRGNPFCTLDC